MTDTQFDTIYTEVSPTPEPFGEDFQINPNTKITSQADFNTAYREYIKIREADINTTKIIALQQLAKGKSGQNKATEVIARHIQSSNTIYSTRDAQNSEMWIYAGPTVGIYMPSAECFIEEVTREILGEAYRQRVCQEIIDKIRADTYIDAKDFFKEADADLCAVENGILNLKTFDLRPFGPEFRFFQKIPVRWDPQAKCPAILLFMSEVISTDDTRLMLELIGSCLHRSPDYLKSVMLNGEGSNGKSKLLAMLRRFLGEQNCKAISLQSMSEDQYAAAELFGCLANVCADNADRRIRDSAMFKSATGGDMISPNRKYLKHLSFVPYAKFFFSTNTLPRIDDQTYAFWRRWVVIHFANRFIKQDDYDRLKESDRAKVRVADPNILAKITTSEELSGLLVMCVKAFKTVMDRGGYTETQTWNEIQRSWNRECNSARAFAEDTLCKGSLISDKIPKSELRQKYVDYCNANRLKPLPDKIFKFAMFDSFGAEEERIRTEDGDRQYVWAGIKFKGEGNSDLSKY